jgi:hypothetical protein
MGDGKSNPFGDGKSGADGNKSGGSAQHRGPDRSQKMGESIAGSFTGDHPEKGDKHLKVDAPSDRKGLVGQTAEGGMKHKPVRFNGGPSAGGENSDSGMDDAVGVGDVRDEPESDSES